MLQNAYFLAKIDADTAENEQHVAEICQKLATTLRVRGPDVEGGLEVPLRDGRRVHPRGRGYQPGSGGESSQIRRPTRTESQGAFLGIVNEINPWGIVNHR